MVQEKKLVDEVSGWLRAYDDGSVDRTWTGPPEVKFMAEAVPPHEDFIEGVATRDVTIDSNSGLRVRIYLPEQVLTAKTKLPILLHFHGGGFCISQADWYMYYHIYARLASPGMGHSFYLNKIAVDMDPNYAAQTASLIAGIKEFVNKH
ncbi:Carboxylesterase [Theobroma cacao]|nr:Carboxylesterase [Theobroma cacao]